MEHLPTGQAGNKGRTYLLYAIGEILLVVIGILIALQVNNWNEDRKEQQLAGTILTQLHEKISRDTLNLSRQVRGFEEMLENAIWLREQFEQDAPYEIRMDTALAIISIFGITEADYSSFDYLENVGIGIIKDQELRDLITRYYADSRQLAGVDDYFELNKYFRQVIYPKFFKRYRYGTYAVPVDYEQLKESSEFRVVLDMCYNDSIFYLNRSRNRQEMAQELLALIEEELGK